ncbi:NAD(P)-dependent oxidoreductase [Clostridium thermarum]|uniref:NAD(P)-dependent oxidoreductase n=1 Tax=Clostridium thermarum TaxID=1716543 RepID=UPI0013D629AF|nr:NAD(P)-dependent oxidoreductase [Clostridium thermarum]
MSKDFGEDIFQLDSDLAAISLLSAKVKVLVVGAGRAGFIKARSFAAKGCSVTVLSLDFMEEFNRLAVEYGVTLIKDAYFPTFLDKYHLIVIAVKDSNIIHEIRKDCKSRCKLHLDCSDHKEGNFVVPSQGKTRNINYSISTKAASPITSTFLMRKIGTSLREYDDTIEYIGRLRKSLKGHERLKEIMTFVSSDDFNFFFRKGYGDTIIKMFYKDI